MGTATLQPGRAGIAVAREARPGGEIHRLRISNEAKLNILDSGLLCELGHALRAIDASPDARAVVIEGAGERAFIGGADIGEMVSLEQDTARSFITLLHDVCRTILEHPLPVIAAIRGHCLGAGLEIAATCDLRLAGPGARFAMPEVRVGIPSVIEAALLPRLIGAGRARDLVMTGRVIDARTAERWGLVEIPEQEQSLEALLEARIEDLFAAEPAALRAQKALCLAWERETLERAVEAGIDAFAAAYETDAPARAMGAFLDRKRN